MQREKVIWLSRDVKHGTYNGFLQYTMEIEEELPEEEEEEADIRLALNYGKYTVKCLKTH